MPIETLLIDGKQYLYFYYYDPETKRKKRVYCGPKGSAEATEKANQFESKYEQAKRQKKSGSDHLTKLFALAAEFPSYNPLRSGEALRCFVDAYYDIKWVSHAYISVLGWLNDDPELLRRLGKTYGRLQKDMTRIKQVDDDLGNFIHYSYPEWYSLVRYRKKSDDIEKPEENPSSKYHVDLESRNMVVEMLKGGIDALEHAQRRFDALQEICRKNNLDTMIEALEFVGVMKAMTDSRKAIQEALGLVAS